MTMHLQIQIHEALIMENGANANTSVPNINLYLRQSQNFLSIIMLIKIYTLTHQMYLNVSTENI